MDLHSIIEQLETGEQDAALAALQGYNQEMNQCFTFNRQEEQDRKRLGELVINFLNKDLQPSCLLACLETVRILTRDQQCLDPFVNRRALSTLASYAGISPTAPHSQPLEGQEDGGKAEEAAEESSEVVKESSPPSENPDQEVIVEALKSISNILLHSETGQVVAADLRLIEGVARRLKQCHDATWNHEVRFFDLRVTFLLTALRVDVREQLARELHGISLLGIFVD